MYKPDTSLRASSHEPSNRAGPVSGTNFVLCSYETFQHGYQDEKWRCDHPGLKVNKQAFGLLESVAGVSRCCKSENSCKFTSTTNRNYSGLQNHISKA